MTEKPKLPSGQTIEWRDENVTSHYSNLMALSMTPFDITIIFGEVGKASPESVEGIGRARIILSPEQASNLRKLLGIALDNYVVNNGELRPSGAVDEDLFRRSMEGSLVKGSNESR